MPIYVSNVQEELAEKFVPCDKFVSLEKQVTVLYDCVTATTTEMGTLIANNHAEIATNVQRLLQQVGKWIGMAIDPLSERICALEFWKRMESFFCSL